MDRVRELIRLAPGTREGMPAGQVNNFRNAWEFATGAEVLSTTPPSIQLARNNKCNFKCVYCPDHRVGNTLPRVELTDDVWGRLEPLVDQATAASFHGISEFFLDKDFFRILERCARAGVILSLNTNGSVCTDRHIAALADYPWGIAINFSLDAATEATYRHIRGWDFPRVLRNIERYMESFSPRRLRTYVSISYVVCKSNVEEMPAAVELGHRLGLDCVKFYPLLEDGDLNWRIAAHDGVEFDYRAEMADRFADRFNQKIAEARAVAQRLGIDAEIPESVAGAVGTGG